ncbi:hypothetical protein Tco_0783076 [Tanacetum coccineum]
MLGRMQEIRLGTMLPGNQNGYNVMQNVGNQVGQNAVQNPGIQNVGNQNGLIVVLGIANQNGNGNVVAARAEGNGNGNNRNQIRCYNCRRVKKAEIQLQAEEFDLMVATAETEEIEKVNANCILMANLQQASKSGTHADKAPVYNSDGSAEIHQYENCYNNEIFNMFTQEEQYTELLELTTGSHLGQPNDNNVSLVESSMDLSGGTIEQHPATTVEETCAFFESLYNNLVIEVEKVNTVNRKMKEANEKLTTELARYKGQEKCFEFNQEKFDELENGYRKSVYQEQRLTKKINAHHLSFAKMITTLNEKISNLNNEISKEKSTVSYLEQEREKLKNDFKTHEDELLDKLIQSEKKIKELDNILVKTDNVDPLSQKLDDENVSLELQTRAQTKFKTDSLQEKLNDTIYDDTIYENTKLREHLYGKFSEQNDAMNDTSVNTKSAKPSILGKPHLQSFRNQLVGRQPTMFQYERPKSSKTRFISKVVETIDLTKSVTSHSVPKTQESKVVKNVKVIAPVMFRINPLKNSREDNLVPNKQVKASVMTKPITVSQPQVITKKDVNSNLNGLSSTGVESTAKTRRPQPRSNTKNDKVISASKSSYIKNKEVEVEEHPRNLQSLNNQKHISSECNNIKLVVRNDKSEVACATCKKCLITANHDVCVFNYVNGMNSCDNNQSVNVSNTTNQKKQNPNVKKSKKLGSKERLASPRPRKPRSCLRWSRTGRIFYHSGKIIESSHSECKFVTSVCDDASASNPREPTSFQTLPFLAVYRNLFVVRRLGLLHAYDHESEAAHQLRLEVYGNCSLWE